MFTIESDMSFLLLCACLQAGKAVVNGAVAIVESIEREDGSGRCWNVHVRYCESGLKYSKFVRTST